MEEYVLCCFMHLFSTLAISPRKDHLLLLSSWNTTGQTCEHRERRGTTFLESPRITFSFAFRLTYFSILVTLAYLMASMATKRLGNFFYPIRTILARTWNSANASFSSSFFYLSFFSFFFFRSLSFSSFILPVFTGRMITGEVRWRRKSFLRKLRNELTIFSLSLFFFLFFFFCFKRGVGTVSTDERASESPVSLSNFSTSGLLRVPLCRDKVIKKFHSCTLNFGRSVDV